MGIANLGLLKPMEFGVRPFKRVFWSTTVMEAVAIPLSMIAIAVDMVEISLKSRIWKTLGVDEQL